MVAKYKVVNLDNYQRLMTPSNEPPTSTTETGKLETEKENVINSKDSEEVQNILIQNVLRRLAEQKKQRKEEPVNVKVVKTSPADPSPKIQPISTPSVSEFDPAKFSRV